MTRTWLCAGVMVLTGLAAACGGSSSEMSGTSAPAEPLPPASPPNEVPPVEAPPPAEPGPVAAACAADADHCCQSDGTLVRPGGCQPSYPRNVVPNVIRGSDGRCEPDPEQCMLRCLPATARIATPSGAFAVASLREGELVYSIDRAGVRLVVPIRRVASVPVRGRHSLLELTLADGRVVHASPSHPTLTGAPLTALSVHAAFDGSTVVAVRRVAYDGDATWDLLPDGPTGAYWADGVLLGSTLAER